MKNQEPGTSPDDLQSEEQAQFIQENLRRIFLLIYRIVGNVDDAQDLTQETFIKALQRQSQLKDREKADRWLSRIASNTAIDYLRRKKNVSLTELAEVPFSLVSQQESPEQFLLRSEKRLQLDDGLAALTERERTALVLRDIEDMPAVEVARVMNCSMATVRSHISNARVKFQKYLESKNA